jgi:hypothetical protein
MTIIRRALRVPIVNIGQLTTQEQYQLNKAVLSGKLSKGKGGPYPALKTVYARRGFDFESDRKEALREYGI